jgi:formylglycine-generating enzyme required for sulfatase activity
MKGASVFPMLMLLGTASCASLSGLSGGSDDAGGSADRTSVVDGSKRDGHSGADGGVARDSSSGGHDAAFDAVSVDAGPCHAPVAGGADGVLVLGEYCIDTTEAPVALYDHFINDINVNPATGQPPECAWNTSYMPYYPVYMGNPNRAKLPQTAVDWCDALAFCTYWGKHLCGNRFDGGALDQDAALKDGQWYAACTNGTSQTYPYGDNYNPDACRTGLAFDAGPAVVPTSSSCQGGVPGLFDMSGNLQEWENSCISSGGDAALDQCVLRGGTWFYPTDSVTCALNNGGALNPRNGGDTSANGVRCCWEPK